MFSFIDILEDYAQHHVVYICKNPDEILVIAKENDIDLTVMSYDQVRSITEFKYPVAFDSYERFVQYLFPILRLYDIDEFDVKRD